MRGFHICSALTLLCCIAFNAGTRHARKHLDVTSELSERPVAWSVSFQFYAGQYSATPSPAKTMKVTAIGDGQTCGSRACKSRELLLDIDHYGTMTAVPHSMVFIIPMRPPRINTGISFAQMSLRVSDGTDMGRTLLHIRKEDRWIGATVTSLEFPSPAPRLNVMNSSPQSQHQPRSFPWDNPWFRRPALLSSGDDPNSMRRTSWPSKVFIAKVVDAVDASFDQVR